MFGKFNRLYSLIQIMMGMTLLAAGCASDQGQVRNQALSGEGDNPQVVATTSFVGDVVGEVGGERIELVVMLPRGANPHSYQPTPRDLTEVANADVVFANGLKLETFLEDLIDNAGGDARVVHVSHGVEVRTFSGESMEGDHQHEGDGDDPGSGAEFPDPHVWFDPLNVIIWTENITEALIEVDPEHAERYRQNAAAYKEELRDLDRWIQGEVSRIPEANRELVTDHAVFGYFAERYGLRQVGFVVPAATTEAQPSGQHIAQLQEKISEVRVPAIFVGRDFDPTLAERIAEDTGVELVPLYFGSLTSSEGPADTYLDFMRENVSAIVEALR